MWPYGYRPIPVRSSYGPPPPPLSFRRKKQEPPRTAKEIEIAELEALYARDAYDATAPVKKPFFRKLRRAASFVVGFVVISGIIIELLSFV